MKYSLLSLTLALFLVSCDSSEPGAVTEESVTFSNEAQYPTLADKAVCTCWPTVGDLDTQLGGQQSDLVERISVGGGGFRVFLKLSDDTELAAVHWNENAKLCDPPITAISSRQVANACTLILRAYNRTH